MGERKKPSGKKWPTKYPEGPSWGLPCHPVTALVTWDGDFVHFSLRVGDTKAQETAFEEGEGETAVWDQTVDHDDAARINATFSEQRRLAMAWDAALAAESK